MFSANFSWCQWFFISALESRILRDRAQGVWIVALGSNLEHPKCESQDSLTEEVVKLQSSLNHCNSSSKTWKQVLPRFVATRTTDQLYLFRQSTLICFTFTQLIPVNFLAFEVSFNDNLHRIAGGMVETGEGRSTREKPVSVRFYPPQIPH